MYALAYVSTNLTIHEPDSMNVIPQGCSHQPLWPLPVIGNGKGNVDDLYNYAVEG